jgi:Flp pilus assembly protein TadD
MISPVHTAIELIRQSRHDLAENIARQAVKDDPDDAIAHSVLAVSLCGLMNFEEAMREAETAIQIAPDESYAHYALAHILMIRGRFADAEITIREALRLEPECVDYLRTFAWITGFQQRWEQSCDAALQGLKIDPEDAVCLNLHAAALLNLGKGKRALAAIESALKCQPENADLHATKGWTLIFKRRYKESIESFREALRINPESIRARNGMIEALKSKIPFYPMLFAHESRLNPIISMRGVVAFLGAVVLFLACEGVISSGERQGIHGRSLIGFYFGMVVVVWSVGPATILMLRCTRVGRISLWRDEIVSSNWFCICALATAVCLIVFDFWRGDFIFYAALGFGFALPPLLSLYKCPIGWPRRTTRYIALGYAIVAAIGWAIVLTTSIVLGIADGVFEQIAWVPLLALLAAATVSQIGPLLLMGATVRH